MHVLVCSALLSLCPLFERVLTLFYGNDRSCACAAACAVVDVIMVVYALPTYQL